jgi:amino acid adenylation domain-containing protein
MEPSKKVDGRRDGAAKTAAKSRLLDLMLKADSRKRQQQVSPLIVQRERGPSIPLSFAQERLWFLDQLGLVGAAYNITMSLRLQGSLDEQALEKCFAELLRRHEILRTHFRSKGGDPVQVIDPPSAPEVHRFDLTGIASEARREQMLDERLQLERAHAFDLGRGPLVRFVLVKISDCEHALLIVLHHSICDGWSLGVLNRELSELYRAFKSGEESPLPQLPIQYADYALWQREWLQGAALDQQLSYWREQLRDAPPHLQLPTDRSRPAIESFRGGTLNFNIGRELTRGLLELGRQSGCTLFMSALAVYQVLLSKWSGEQDIVVGSPIAGRNVASIEQLIGFFVNTLALRGKVSGHESFRELLMRTKELTLAAYSNQDLPFELLVKDLRPERNLSRQPIFQAFIALHNFPTEKLALPDLTWTWRSTRSDTTHFDLALFLYETPDGLAGVFEYSTDLFDNATIARMARHYSNLAGAVVAQPSASIDSIQMMDEEEFQMVVRDWNATHVSYPPAQLIHELVEEQAGTNAQNIAVICGEHRLTYEELNGRANRLAHYLRDRGAAPDQFVGLYLDRGLDTMVGILAILKAGAAYLPLDANYPRERISYMLRDTRPRLILSQSWMDRKWLSDIETVLLDLEARSIDREADTNPAGVKLRPENLAYVIFTSGSTGRPKGVAIGHRNAVNLINWGRRVADPTVFGRTLFSTSLNFDLSVYEMFVPLSVGGSLHVVQNILSLAEETSEASLINTVPSSVTALLEGAQLPDSTTVVNLAGEALRKDTVDAIFSSSGVEKICNLYGPSETTTYSTWIQMSKATGFVDGIGRPVDNTQIYVMDSRLCVVPIGVVGEIFIGGAGVARGYLNQAALTAERFLPDPFAGDSAARLYKTGDLGRWCADGTLQFLGRNDHQVKIRGFRVELGEIEQQLTRHPDVKESVVVARKESPSDAMLVAYVVAEDQRTQQIDFSVSSEDWRGEILSEWEAVHEQTYAGNEEVRPSYVGWRSSYTGGTIPEADMEEWVACTVESIQELHPQNVLEIGCGVGLFIERLSPDCRRYVATDFAPSAISSLRHWIATRPDLAHVELSQRAAIDVAGFQAGEFDTVIINSVVQYFPDVNYLIKVLEGVIPLLQKNGTIFLGDIRSLELLPVFHASVQLSKASATVRAEQLRKRIANAIEQDKELVIDPALFSALVGRISRITSADIRLKWGAAQNELTRYRYDVVLRLDEGIRRVSPCRSYVWGLDINSLHELERMEKGAGECIHVASVPNARVEKDLAAKRLIAEAEDHLEAGVLRQRVQAGSCNGLDPESIRTWARNCGWRSVIRPGMDASYDLYLTQTEGHALHPGITAAPESLVKPWIEYTNDPLQRGFRQLLIPKLRSYMAESVPEYMLPSVWVVLPRLPRSPNGKIDRSALPNPQGRPEELGDYVAPRTQTEVVLARIWCNLLQVDQVGVLDNFFELGGHSLHSIKLIARIAHELKVQISAVAIFQHPTVERMAAVIEELRVRDGRPDELEDVENGVI